ncbi:MAG: exopolysaccharide biosynthesis polyprenyl glycosylphosphotransferase [Bacillota bacterium]|nr:exopolysaccharide biosynthesis polyprenyl glycosylphosphotransferase [Bacillota bacterium]
MTKIGVINCILDTVCFVLILMSMPTWAYWFAKRLIVVFVMMQFLAGRFQGKSLLFWDELKRITFSHAWFYVISFVIAYQYTGEQLFQLFIIVCISYVVDVLLARYTRIWFRKWIKKKVVIFGTGEAAASLVQTIVTNRFSTMEVVACVDMNSQLLIKEDPVITEDVIDIEQAEEFLVEHEIDTVIFAIPSIPNSTLKRWMHQVSMIVNEVKFLPQINHSVNFNTKIDDFDGTIVISTSEEKRMSLFDRSFKRLLDIGAAIVGCLLLIPLTAYVYYKNKKAGEEGPIFFTQERIGRDGKLFKIYKYRTMVMNAEQKLEELMEKDPKIKEEYETFKKLENDPRITEVGDFLRRTSLDEFPQFINVLFGQMSLIGPRPYLPREKEDMGVYYDRIILTKPGITGMWQTHGRSEVSFEERLELDDYYSHNWSMWLDITLLVRTFRTVMLRVGAH